MFLDAVGIEVEGGMLICQGIVVRQWGLSRNCEIFLHHASSTVIYYYMVGLIIYKTKNSFADKKLIIVASSYI